MGHTIASADWEMGQVVWARVVPREARKLFNSPVVPALIQAVLLGVISDENISLSKFTLWQYSKNLLK